MLDSHHHLWPRDEEAAAAGHSLRSQDFLLPELEEACASCGVEGTVVVQTRQSLEETEWLLQQSELSERIRGVVGWLPLTEPDVGALVRRLRKHPGLVSVRHPLQHEPDEFFAREDFGAGLYELAEYQLSFDLLISQRQLPVAIELIDRQRGLNFVVDHLAQPAIQVGRIEREWRDQMRQLAERDHVGGVKFSGLATRFPQDGPVDRDTLQAYFEETLAIFGPKRVLFGTDWPHSLERFDTYRAWVDTVVDLVHTLSPTEQRDILHDNAERIYNLTPLEDWGEQIG